MTCNTIQPVYPYYTVCIHIFPSTIIHISICSLQLYLTLPSLLFFFYFILSPFHFNSYFLTLICSSFPFASSIQTCCLLISNTFIPHCNECYSWPKKFFCLYILFYLPSILVVQGRIIKLCVNQFSFHTFGTFANLSVEEESLHHYTVCTPFLF